MSFVDHEQNHPLNSFMLQLDLTSLAGASRHPDSDEITTNNACKVSGNQTERLEPTQHLGAGPSNL
jgi:hypothetical protein